MKSQNTTVSGNSAARSVLTIIAFVFAAYSATAVSSSTSSFGGSSLLQAAYAQEEQQQQQDQSSSSSAVADRAARMSAAVDATLRYYARAIGAQYVEADDVRPIAGVGNINALEDVTIPIVPVGSSLGNTTGIASMGDYLVAMGLVDKSHELFLKTAREMRNASVEDVLELQTTLLQLDTLIEQRAPYNLVEDVVQNLQGHLQRLVAGTEEFTTAGTTTTTTAGGNTTDDNATTTASTTPSEDTTTGTEAGTTDDTTTTTTTIAPSPLLQ